MKRFILEKSNKEFYTNHSGLTLIGQLINRYTSLNKTSRKIKKRHGIPNIELLRAYIGLLSLAKSDYDALENYRHDPFFRQALGIKQMPSTSRLRQRFDEDAVNLIPLINQANIEFIQRIKAPITPNKAGYIVIDADLFPMDNSKTKKEGVSRTYKQFDGYGAMAVYIGEEGWNIACELREGSWHCQKEFSYTLERIVQRAKSLSSLPLLMRLDSGHDAAENRMILTHEEVDFIIKWNPRRQNLEQWIAKANQQAEWVTPREGKRVAIFSEDIEETDQQTSHRYRRVIRIIERTIDKKGQHLILPDITLEGWWTTLEESTNDDEQIIQLYKEHATSEQFHSEFKTDLDIERLPSGKFDTNDLILALASITYNMLRWIGISALLGKEAPIRHQAKRRRLRTVIQEIMYLAARLISTGNRLKLKFSRYCQAFTVFNNTYSVLIE